ncbi:MAG: hypothetical protein AAGF47_02800 [Planctomycetota bacterium]
MTERSQILSETAEARREAERLLSGLVEARLQSEARLAELSRTDILKQITGKSSLDTAIDSTERMIRALDRVLGDIRTSLSPEEQAVLDDALRDD